MCASYNMDSRHYLSFVYLLSTRFKYKNHLKTTKNHKKHKIPIIPNPGSTCFSLNRLFKASVWFRILLKTNFSSNFKTFDLQPLLPYIFN